jgi:catechol 2,3-dioxygenase-like lactoylglutathione lyase family enzyme
MISAARFGTRDLARASGFYDAIAELIGAKRAMERPEMVGYRGADGATFVIGKPFEGDASAGNGNQMVIAATSRAVVDAVHAKALAMGGSCAGPPGIRGDDPNGFYGAYFRDLDGNKLCVYRIGAPDE